MTGLFKKTTPIENRTFAISGKTIGFLFSILLHILIVFLLISTRFPIQRKLIRNKIREIRLVSPENGYVIVNQNIPPKLPELASKKQHSANPKMMYHPDSGTPVGMPPVQIPELDFSLIPAKKMSLSKKFPNPEAGLYSSSGFLNLKKQGDLEREWKLHFPGQLKFVPTDPLNTPFKTGKNPNPNSVSLAGDNTVDLTTWSKKILDRIHQQWIVPSSAVAGQKGRVKIKARVKADGSILSVKITAPSSAETYNQAAKKAITSCSPFPPLPDNFSKNWIEVVLLFCYND